MAKVELRSGEQLDDLMIDDRHIIQNPSLYMMTSDAVLLSKFARVGLRDNVCDFCTGSGIIPIHMALTGGARHFVGVEIQECMADMAKRSVTLNDLDDRIEILCRDVKGISHDYREQFDVVTCNPPYRPLGVGEATDNEVSRIARHEVLITLAEILDEVQGSLKYGGRLYMIHRADRLGEIIAEMSKRNLEPKEICIVCRKPHIGDTVMICATKGGKRGVKVTTLDIK